MSASVFGSKFHWKRSKTLSADLMQYFTERARNDVLNRLRAEVVRRQVEIFQTAQDIAKLFMARKRRRISASQRYHPARNSEEIT